MQSHHYLHCLYKYFMIVQWSPFIMLWMGSIGMDILVVESCYEGQFC